MAEEPPWQRRVPDYAEGRPLDAAGGLGARQENVSCWLRERGAAFQLRLIRQGRVQPGGGGLAVRCFRPAVIGALFAPLGSV
jgi:hypothetical protein